MKFGKNKRKPEQKETFIGSFRLVADDATIKHLCGNAIVSQKVEDGIRTTKYADGKIEFITMFERIQQQIKEMRRVNPVAGQPKI